MVHPSKRRSHTGGIFLENPPVAGVFAQHLPVEFFCTSQKTAPVLENPTTKTQPCNGTQIRSRHVRCLCAFGLCAVGFRSVPLVSAPFTAPFIPRILSALYACHAAVMACASSGACMHEGSEEGACSKIIGTRSVFHRISVFPCVSRLRLSAPPQSPNKRANAT